MYDKTDVRTDSKGQRVYSPRLLGGAYVLPDEKTERSVRRYLWIKAAIGIALLYLFGQIVIIALFDARGILVACLGGLATLVVAWAASWACDRIFLRRLQQVRSELISRAELARIDSPRRERRLVACVVAAGVGLIVFLSAYLLGEKNVSLTGAIFCPLALVITVTQLSPVPERRGQAAVRDELRSGLGCREVRSSSVGAISRSVT